MIGRLTRSWDSFLGRGEASVTVPPLDGALFPNRLLDEADMRVALTNADCLVVVSGQLVASAGNTVYVLEDERKWRKQSEHESEIACIAAVGTSGLAVALISGEIILTGGDFDGRRYSVAPDVRCITAMTIFGNDLYVANGSATNSLADWQLDLLQGNASGSIWRTDLESGKSNRIAGDLSYPAGIIVDDEGLVYSEAWKHRLTRISTIDTIKVETLCAELPGYPGRIAKGQDGYWLAVFAPRSQLVEFVLRESDFAKSMVADIPKDFWIAPKLRAGRSFYEPMQGGGVKHLGLLKPWSPTMSAGLCVKLDANFQPRLSLHSRADGATHGITSVIEHEARVFAAAHGDDVVVSIALEEVEDAQ